MTTDFDGLNDILRADMYKFIDAMKDTLIPMLDMGLDSGLKINLIRSIHGLKSLSGMFELHELTNFVNDTEEVVNKIFALDRDNIANDLLNDLFVIKDQIEEQFKEYIDTGTKVASKTTKAYNSDCIEEFTRHYVEYKMGDQIQAKQTAQTTQPTQNRAKEQAKPSVATQQPTQQPIPQQAPAPVIPQSTQDTPSTKSQSDFYLDDNVMYFKPLSLHKDDATRYQKLFVDNLDNVKEINVDLRQTNKLDISGIQFIQAIKKHCKVSGVKFVLAGQSELVVLEAGMLGIEL